MPSDIITNNIAEICLATGCAALCDSPAGIMLAGPGFAIPVFDPAWEARTGRPFKTCIVAEYLENVNFEAAARAISSSLAEASLSTDQGNAGCAGYVGLLKHIDSTPMAGRIILTPIGNVWPDAMASFLPYDQNGPRVPDTIHDRIFPLMNHIDSVALTLPDHENIDAWCMYNPSLLAWDGDVCCGWNAAHARTVRVNIETVDFKKPWRIIRQPDGSETISPATPLVLKSPMLSYYETV